MKKVCPPFGKWREMENGETTSHPFFTSRGEEKNFSIFKEWALCNSRRECPYSLKIEKGEEKV